SNGTGKTLQGNLSPSSSWYGTYANQYPTESDNGAHPQNLFSMYLRTPEINSDQSISVKINADNLSNPDNRNPWNGIFLVSRRQSDATAYYAGIREDGHTVIKKKVNGVYSTLAEDTLFPGTYDEQSNPSLLPKNTW